MPTDKGNPTAWDKVRGAVAGVAPMVATLLGGPAGAAVGAAIAGVLGVPATPDDVMKALSVDPASAVKLKELETTRIVELARLEVEERKAELTAGTAAVTAVNTTMQTEAKAEHWVQYSWRPFIGFSTGVAFTGMCFFIGLLAYRAVMLRDANAMMMIPQLISSLSALFAIPGAILGVTAWHRGMEKRALVSE